MGIYRQLLRSAAIIPVMGATGIGILGMLLSVPAVLLVWWRWQLGTVKKAKQWPKTEATIQNVIGAIEVVAQTKFNTLRLPVFAFSYRVQGEYYSGRFALVPHTVEYDESLIDRMIGRKLVVCCDPAHPDRWLIPDEMIDGYKVEQKTDPHRILRDVGLCLFLVSFFLPALGDMGGFQSAFFGIIFVRPWQPDDKISSLAAFGAWLNPEVLLLFFLSVFQRCPRLRILLVVTILFSIPMTWIALYRMDHAGVAVFPLGPGHFLWIAGILLIVFAESSVIRFSPLRWLTVVLGIVTVAMSVPILIGLTMRAPSEADDFHYDQAWDTQNPAECANQKR